MIGSAELIFSNDQAITASAASTNTIDLGSPGTVLNAPVALSRDIGPGMPVSIGIEVTTAFATLTSLTIGLQVDDNSSFSSAVTVLSTPAIPLASLVVGYKSPIIHVPQGINERYWRLFYTVAGSDATAGAIWAGIVADVQTNR